MQLLISKQVPQHRAILLFMKTEVDMNFRSRWMSLYEPYHNGKTTILYERTGPKAKLWTNCCTNITIHYGNAI